MIQFLLAMVSLGKKESFDKSATFGRIGWCSFFSEGSFLSGATDQSIMSQEPNMTVMVEVDGSNIVSTIKLKQPTN